MRHDVFVSLSINIDATYISQLETLTTFTAETVVLCKPVELDKVFATLLYEFKLLSLWIPNMVSSNVLAFKRGLLFAVCHFSFPSNTIKL